MKRNGVNVTLKPNQKQILYIIFAELCNVPKDVSVHGGWTGISEKQCVESGMCWKIWDGPNCYRPKRKSGLYSIAKIFVIPKCEYIYIYIYIYICIYIIN